jgi:hypothetical protein
MTQVGCCCPEESIMRAAMIAMYDVLQYIDIIHLNITNDDRQTM